MHAGFLDVLHHAADEHLTGVVADGVDVDLGGVLQEAVDEHRALGGQAALLAEAAEAGQLGHRAGEVVAVVHDLHRPTAEHVARTHQHREADLLDDAERLLEVGGGAAGRLRDVQLVAQRVPLLAVLGEVDGRRRRAGDELGRQLTGQLQRGLPAERHDDLRGHSPGRGRLGGDDVEHVLAGERLEVQTIAGVVVGATRSRGCSSPSPSRSRPRAARTRRARSSSRTRCPDRCGSGRCRG